ncbi:SDR family NAD(P)-dependent oxidoreductase [Jongsikchunia kroppenstedtii]|uniref:SDR family NAD(P)-dependent oxidoreductase n=1 Tax=Jongsikchunia kroppenstedtii TaxID=1121721 RepID=UPI000381ED11|nr:SDR family NAD(P)-dependent oxidoreductase [Jongsikchunia kroppenstedtii]
MKLNNTRAVVTGASRGLGKSIAAELAKRGVDVAMVARKSAKLDEAAKEVGGKAYPCDLTDPAAVAELLATIEADGGPIDILVNNAGLDNVGLFPDATADEVRNLIQVNLLSPMELCRQAIPAMVARGRGHIVNVSSMAAVSTSPGVTLYATSKAGLSHFTAGIRMELAGKPVGTTLVQIGNVKTDMIDNINSFPPAQRAVERAAKLHILPKEDLEPDFVASEIADAILNNKERVTLPKALMATTLLVEAPRKMSELMLRGLDLDSK